MKKQFYSYFDNELSQKEKEKNKSVNRIYSVIMNMLNLKGRVTLG